MIKILPVNVSNLIAAGEVVQRPSSVVKELVENSIDAGADNITVNISDSGRTLIQVVDNGKGMRPDEAVLAFERHATSKIAEADDLNSILTFGFRGEALPSISAVAEVTLKTRQKNTDSAIEVIFAGSHFQSQKEISAPEGTNISVRNIFYNVPARRKFLKSDNAEFRHIMNEFARVALCHPECALTLTHNGKTIHSLRGNVNLKQRIIECQGKELNKELIEIGTSTSVVDIKGFICTPESSKKSLGNQFFFINGRYFRSPYLHKAVVKAYEKLIPNDHTPSYFIYFDIDPGVIDINIHPSKTEIKFEDESIIFNILNAAIREALGKNAFIPSIDFDKEGVPDIPFVRKGDYIPPPKIDFDPLFNPFESERNEYNKQPEEYKYVESKIGGRPVVDGYSGSGGGLFSDSRDEDRPLLTVQNKYIIINVKSGIMLINISRARERILYERYIDSLINSSSISQKTLFPQMIELAPYQHSIIVNEREKLTLLGFEIKDLGNNQIEVSGLPDGLIMTSDTLDEVFDELISSIEELESDILLAPKEKLALILSKSGASVSKCQISKTEAQFLVDSLLTCREPDRTPDGRLCMKIISIDDLGNML